MAFNLGYRKICDGGQGRSGCAILRLDRHSLDHRTNKTCKSCCIHMLTQLLIFNASLNASFEGIQRPVAQARYMSRDRVVFDRAGQHRSRDHTTMWSAATSEILGRIAKNAGQCLERIGLFKCSRSRDAHVILVPHQRLPIELKLRVECRVEALGRNPHCGRQVGDRRTLVAEPPESLRSFLQHGASIKGTGAAARAWGGLKNFHSDHSRIGSPGALFTNDHCDYRGTRSMSLPDISHASARIDAVIDKALVEKRIVGAVVLTALDGQPIYRRAAGLCDLAGGKPMAEDAIFRLASITKPITTAAALRLVEEGRLDLHSPITNWLPDFRPALTNGTRPEITVHHLLTHTSGLGYSFLEPHDGPYHALNVSDGLDQPGLSLEENLSRLQAAPLSFAPGTGWRYSLGLDVLGAILEKVEGRSLRDIVADKVTGPLGLADTDFSVADTSRLALAYADGDPEPVAMNDRTEVPIFGTTARFAPSRILNSDSYPSGGAGMAGTASDVLRFLETIRLGGGSILTAETVQMMATDHVGVHAETQGPGWGFGYGSAVLVDPKATGTPQAAGTLQWGGAYGHSWFVDRSNRLTVIALTNTAFEGMSGAFPVDIRNAVYG